MHSKVLIFWVKRNNIVNKKIKKKKNFINFFAKNEIKKKEIIKIKKGALSPVNRIVINKNINKKNFIKKLM